MESEKELVRVNFGSNYFYFTSSLIVNAINYLYMTSFKNLT
jgi:hypothetical protein